MSSMADEMAARLEQDGGAGLATAAPGTEVPPEQPTASTPPAGVSNAERGGGPPETVPYSRFKEVNDQLGELRGFQQLREWGYDPDSLGRLASFEAAYYRDPVGTWAAMADNLDLPQDLKDALGRHVAAQGTDDGSGAQGVPSTMPQPGDDQPPSWAKPLLEDHQRRAEVEAETGRQQTLDSILAHWRSLDEKDQLPATSDRVMLNHIGTVATREQFQTVEQLAEAARSEYLAARDEILGAAVRNRPGVGSLPTPVPGGAVGASPPVNFGGDIRRATLAAQAAIERGELPPLSG